MRKHPAARIDSGVDGYKIILGKTEIFMVGAVYIALPHFCGMYCTERHLKEI